MNQSQQSGGFTQSFVNQVPKFERMSRERRGRRANQVMSKAQIIRPDKRQKPKYF